MLLAKRLTHPNHWIAAGQLSLVAGIALQRFLHPPADFWQGFVAGLSGVLIGLSIVLNLRGLTLWRRERS
jgi:hypothetical protein